jgi:hypothetical protein
LSGFVSVGLFCKFKQSKREGTQHSPSKFGLIACLYVNFKPKQLR